MRSIAIFLVSFCLATQSFATPPTLSERDALELFRDRPLLPPIQNVVLQGVVTIDRAAGDTAPSCSGCTRSVIVKVNEKNAFAWGVIGQPSGPTTRIAGNLGVLTILELAASEGIIKLTPVSGSSDEYVAEITDAGGQHVELGPGNEQYLATVPGPKMSKVKIIKTESKRLSTGDYNVVSATYSVEATPFYLKLRAAMYGIEQESPYSRKGDRKVIFLFKYEATRKWRPVVADDSELSSDFNTHRVQDALIGLTGRR
jgi:hypothetical protein